MDVDHPLPHPSVSSAAAAAAASSPPLSTSASPPTTASSSVATAHARTLMGQGAEARMYSCTFLGRPCIVKERFAKAYRHPTLDQKLTQRRLRQEAANMLKCLRAGVEAPTVYFVDIPNSRLYMECIAGHTVKTVLWSRTLEPDATTALMHKIGTAIARLHEADLIHGDLTTSNMMVRDGTNALVMIDFGLAYTASLAEDKAVDLYVLERAFLSTHPQSEPLVAALLDAYAAAWPRSKEVLAKLERVRARGRKKLAFG